jgi:hypothetical protein
MHALRYVSWLHRFDIPDFGQSTQVKSGFSRTTDLPGDYVGAGYGNKVYFIFYCVKARLKEICLPDVYYSCCINLCHSWDLELFHTPGEPQKLHSVPIIPRLVDRNNKFKRCKL